MRAAARFRLCAGCGLAVALFVLWGRLFSQSATSEGGAQQLPSDALQHDVFVIEPSARSWRLLFLYCSHPPPCVTEEFTDASRSIFIGVLSQHAQRTVGVGERVVFGIQARDAHGRDRKCGGDAFKVEIRGIAGIFVGTATDNADGTYSFAAQLHDAGVYTVRARLDSRGCWSSTQCRVGDRSLVAEWIGEEGAPPPVITVRARRNGVSDAASASGCVRYGDKAPDDPSLRTGRWKFKDPACCEGPLLQYPGCARYTNGSLVWVPVRPRLSIDEAAGRLRNVWMHSIGDSLSRNIVHFVVDHLQATGALGPVSSTCYRVKNSRAMARSSDALVVESPRECEKNCTLPGYVEFVKVYSFPRANVTVSYMLLSPLQDAEHFVPQRDGFLPWADPSFLAAMARGAFAVHAHSTRSESNGLDTASGGNASVTVPAPYAVPTRSFAHPLVPDRSLVPTHVMFNVGLHHVSSMADIEAYPAHLKTVLDRLNADFAAPRTQLQWRSTAQTQFDSKALPPSHRCRTAQRVAMINELAADIIGEAGLPVIDFSGISFGRGDAAPDNRHYRAEVELEFATEWLNAVVGNCGTSTARPDDR